MKFWSMLFIALFCAFTISFIPTSHLAFADDDDYTEDHESNKNPGSELLEETGGVVGWGTVVFAGGAALLFPARRSLKKLIKSFPNQKQTIVSGTKLLGSGHIFFGSIAVGLSALHGLMMYLSKGELGTREWIGISGVALFLLASLFGFILSKNKSNKGIRSTHMMIVLGALLLGAVHIAI